MPLTRQHGNMYPWVTHMHTHLRGECSHRCVYCYAQKGPGACYYSGPQYLEEKEMKVRYTTRLGEQKKVIFLEHNSDLFAASVPTEYVVRILEHARQYPQNEYVIQTKNPMGIVSRPKDVRELLAEMQDRLILGVTIETDVLSVAKTVAPGAPSPWSRYLGLRQCLLHFPLIRTFVTIEPICVFSGEIAAWIASIQPDWVNIGADSKKSGLLEPSPEMVRLLIERLKKNGIEIRQKHNLERLLS